FVARVELWIDARTDTELAAAVARVGWTFLETAEMVFSELSGEHAAYGNPLLRRVGLQMALAVHGGLTPVVLAQMAAMMLRPPRQIIEPSHIPESVVDGAHTEHLEHPASVIDSLSRVRTLCDELGLTRRPYLCLWRILGVAA
ncbi:MAG: hypothetical protein ACYDDZ_11580, partial [Acidimicrobiales bacterium]